MNGSLYVDWPWGFNRFNISYGNGGMITMLYYVLDNVSDMPDSAFFFASQTSFFPHNIPFPSMCESPSFKSSEVAFPWTESFYAALTLYRRMAESKFPHEMTEDWSKATPPLSTSYSSNNTKETSAAHLPWEQRHSKAAYYASLIQGRQMLFDQAASRPDLFAAGWIFGGVINPWHPESLEDTIKLEDLQKLYDKIKAHQLLHMNSTGKSLEGANATDIELALGTAGYSSHLFHTYLTKKFPYRPGHYKYVVVLDGGFGDGVHFALSGRLANLLCTSSLPFSPL
jgi:hypothetical protein